jgi:predicted  nucleic acid-binding Zn-ribbon protein
MLMSAEDEAAYLRRRLSKLQTEVDDGKLRIRALEADLVNARRELAVERDAGNEVRHELDSFLQRLDHLLVETASDFEGEP